LAGGISFFQTPQEETVEKAAKDSGHARLRVSIGAVYGKVVGAAENLAIGDPLIPVPGSHGKRALIHPEASYFDGGHGRQGCRDVAYLKLRLAGRFHGPDEFAALSGGCGAFTQRIGG
jgi:hypothetical protein